MSVKFVMPVLAELRWYLAVRLMGWALDLIKREASKETLLAFAELSEKLSPDKNFQTVPMRKQV